MSDNIVVQVPNQAKQILQDVKNHYSNHNLQVTFNDLVRDGYEQISNCECWDTMFIPVDSTRQVNYDLKEMKISGDLIEDIITSTWTVDNIILDNVGSRDYCTETGNHYLLSTKLLGRAILPLIIQLDPATKQREDGFGKDEVTIGVQYVIFESGSAGKDIFRIPVSIGSDGMIKAGNYTVINVPDLDSISITIWNDYLTVYSQEAIQPEETIWYQYFSELKQEHHLALDGQDIVE